MVDLQESIFLHICLSVSIFQRWCPMAEWSSSNGVFGLINLQDPVPEAYKFSKRPKLYISKNQV